MSKPCSIIVAALYKFVQLPDFRELRLPLLEMCRQHCIKGTLLLAEEGINGTIAGSRSDIDRILDYLRADPRLSDLEHKESRLATAPFHRMKVKLRKEIVTMGVPEVDAGKKSGIRVGPEAWNALLSDPEILVIDTRNQYEHQVGTFKNAVSPQTTSFREFPDYVKNELDPGRHKKIAMFCTGGIRCEKASAYLLNRGFAEVYFLHGGILKYLEEIKPEENLWQGECFVFDGRIAVDKQINKGSYEMCYSCRMPLSPEDRESPQYESGVSCPHCFGMLTEQRRARLNERRYQVQLAEAREDQHIGISLAERKDSIQLRRSSA
jgi:UPF0176 protein